MQPLEEFLREAVRTAVEELHSPIYIHSEPVLTRQDTSTAMSFGARDKYLPYRAAHAVLARNPSFRAFVEADPRYARLKAFNQSESSAGEGKAGSWSVIKSPDDLLADAAAQLFGQLKRLNRWDNEACLNVISGFETCLDTQECTLVSWYVFRGLYGNDVDRLDLGSCTLRKLSDSEIVAIVGYEPDGELMQDEHLITNQWILECPQQRRVGAKVYREVGERADELARNVLASLRLAKEGRVDFQRRYESLIPGWTVDRGVGGEFPNWRSYPPMNSYACDPDTFARAQAIYKTISATNLPSQLATAIERFSQRFQRHSDDDRLVDLIICLEALTGDSSGANQFKVALRTCVAVEEDPVHRARIRDLIQLAYSRRNAFVHGGKRGAASVSIPHLEGVVRTFLNLQADRLAAGRGLLSTSDLDEALLRAPQPR